MKAVLRKQHFKIAALAIAALFAGTHASAENTGKTGTTIVFSKNTAQGLYGSGASNSTKANQWFAFLRHNIAHVQIQSCNYPKLNTNGTGAFAENNNDMLFNSDGNFRVTNYHNGSYDQVCLAVIAPKGYRFMSYEWEGVSAVLTSNTSTEVTTASICEFTFNEDGSSITPKADSLTIGSKDNWEVNLVNGSNVLYFRVSTGVAAQVDVLAKSLKLTYDIDQPFATQLPTSTGASTLHTGLLDFGTFTNNNKGAGYNTYADANLTDLQSVNFWQTANGSTTSTTPATTTVGSNQYYVVGSNGDYYVEAPAKFRIVEATLNFQRASSGSTTTTYTTVSSITSGEEYIITDGNGNFLNNTDGTITVGTSASSATKWTVSKNSSYWYTYYTIQNGDYYLALDNDRALTLSTSSDDWSWSSRYGFYQSGVIYYYQLHYSSTEGWTAARSSSLSTSNTSKLQQETTTTTTATYPGSDFKATVYATNDASFAEKSISTTETSDTVQLTGLNNDAVRFKISGLAANTYAFYNVKLTLMPLNPELQNITVTSTVSDGTSDIQHSTTTTSEDFTFSNGGEYVTVIVPKDHADKAVTLSFQDAKNENATQWYDNGSLDNADNNGYSNYFLVNSEADNGQNDAVSLSIETNNHPTDRTSATQAGTVQLTSTNIAAIAAGTATKLEDTEFKKTSAKYGTVTLTSKNTTGTYYIYTADVPTYTLLPSTAGGTQHIDFRYYKLPVERQTANETPVVTIKPLYTSTLKGQNNKNADIAADKSETLDETVTFFGATVTAKASSGNARGYLTSDDIVNALRAAVKAEAEKTGSTFKYNSEDALRGLLYLDMSSLASVDVNAFTTEFNDSTADNCLYVMYPGFSRADADNIIAGNTANGFQAVSNITVHDQQPFFAPYAFTTGTYTANYERMSTNGKAKVRNMAAVLPFTVELDENGHVKTASDEVDYTTTYYNLTSQGELKRYNEGKEDELTYGAKMTVVTDGKAEANKPYYILKANEAEAGFSYAITGASFAATELTDGAEQLTNQAAEGAWKAVGTYAGVTPDNADTKWYFAKEMLWKSGALKNSEKFNVLPFRAYFEGEAAAATIEQAKIVFSDDDIVNGISEVRAQNGALTVAAQNGALVISAAADSHYAVYTAAGQLVAQGTLSAGESRTVAAQKGLYIVNNVKTIVK